MRIHDDHFYHGAALVQVVEHPKFEAIDVLTVNGSRCETGFLVNQRTALYMRYRKEKKPSFDEHVFKFSDESVSEIKRARREHERLFLGLVCVEGREICCLPYETFTSVLKKRRAAEGPDRSASFDIIVALPARGRFQVYANAPRQRGTILSGTKHVIPRGDFPSALFG